jgi:hypothetical protein
VSRKKWIAPIELTLIIASLDPADRSSSRLVRRYRPSQAKVRSMV